MARMILPRCWGALLAVGKAPSSSTEVEEPKAEFSMVVSDFRLSKRSRNQRPHSLLILVAFIGGDDAAKRG